MATDVPGKSICPANAGPDPWGTIDAPALGNPDNRANTPMMTDPSMKSRLAVVALAMAAMVGCGGGEKPKPESTAAAPGAAPGAPPPAAAAPGAAQPITGKTWDVKMYADEKGSRFDPVNITIKAGDGIRWTLVNGPPHNVAFWSDSIPGGAASVLQGNMPNPMGTLSGTMMVNPNDTYTVSFAGVPPGTYHYYCVPHLALGMKGIITVQ
jgi:plastocyanin